jgi:hypothetical protein
MRTVVLASVALAALTSVAHATPSATVKWVRIEDGFAKAHIERIVRSRTGNLVVCYKTELTGSPKLAGSIIATARIRKDGTVEDAHLKLRLGDSDKLARCLEDVFKAMTFGASSDGHPHTFFVGVDFQK